MLVLQWLVSPFVAVTLMGEWWWASSSIWLISTSYWTLPLGLRLPNPSKRGQSKEMD